MRSKAGDRAFQQRAKNILKASSISMYSLNCMQDKSKPLFPVVIGQKHFIPSMKGHVKAREVQYDVRVH